MVMTQQKPTPFEWTGARERAAALLADGELTDQGIADEVGVNRWTLWSWKRHPDFKARVADHVDRLGKLAARYVLGRRAARLAALQRRHDALEAVIAERAAQPGMESVPGGRTGLLVKTVKQLGSGDAAVLVNEYRVDGVLLKDLREIEKQAAIECGQWVRKGEVSGQVEHTVGRSVLPEIAELRKLPPEELVRMHQEMLRLPGPNGVVLEDD
jgi:hypothetical protein